MVFGGISRKGKTDIKIFRLDKGETCDGAAYTETLQNFLVNKGNSLFGKGKWRVEQDNVRPHIVWSVKELLKNEKIRLIPHPPYSPDLNAVEKVWNLLKNEVNCREYKNCDELEEGIKNSWEKITLETMNSLINNQMENVKKVIEKNGEFAD